MGITRAGCGSSSRSNSRSSMPIACFEKTLKLTPAGVTKAPSGAACPSVTSGAAGLLAERGASDVSVLFMLLLPRRLVSRSRNCPSSDLEVVPGVEPAEERDQRRHQTGPSRLVARAETGAIVAVEVLVEQQMVAPVRIGLKRLRAAEHRPPSILVANEDVGNAPGNVFGDVEQVHPAAGTGRALDGERVAVEQVELHQGADQQHVHRHPDRAAPVRVP